MTQTATGLRQVLGEGVRRVRETAGLRQDDVARAARTLGLAWDRSRIAALERGEKAVSAEELALLPVVLHVAGATATTVLDLIAPDSEIALSSKVDVSGSDLRDLLAGGDARRIALRASFSGRDWAGALVRADAIGARVMELGIVDPMTGTRGEIRRILKLEGEVGEADRRAATRLHEDPVVIVGLSHALWGRSMSAERDRLVDEQSAADDPPARLQAFRGRVTRRLVEQLADEIQKRAGRI